MLDMLSTRENGGNKTKSTIQILNIHAVCANSDMAGVMGKCKSDVDRQVFLSIKCRMIFLIFKSTLWIVL